MRERKLAVPPFDYSKVLRGHERLRLRVVDVRTETTLVFRLVRALTEVSGRDARADDE